MVQDVQDAVVGAAGEEDFFISIGDNQALFVVEDVLYFCRRERVCGLVLVSKGGSVGWQWGVGGAGKGSLRQSYIAFRPKSSAGHIGEKRQFLINFKILIQQLDLR